MGSCESVNLEDQDFARYFSIYHTETSVTGIGIQTDAGINYGLGSLTGEKRTFTFEPNSLLVGFYGTKSVGLINSVGLIYLD